MLIAILQCITRASAVISCIHCVVHEFAEWCRRHDPHAGSSFLAGFFGQTIPQRRILESRTNFAIVTNTRQYTLEVE